MSRVGKLLIKIPSSVSVKIEEQDVFVEGLRGKSSYIIPSGIQANLNDKELTFVRKDESKKMRALHGTTRANIFNIIRGVSEGWSKSLEIIGVGYRMEVKGKALNFLLGYSHPILLEPPTGIEFKLEGNTKVTIFGMDKQQVGQVAADIRSYRPPEPYKGKGVRYVGEVVRRKEVKKS